MHKKTLLLRYIAAGLMFYLGLFYALSFFGNITDYQFNLDFVKTLLSMHGVPAHAGVAWRSIQSPELHKLAYWCVLVAEALISIISFWGAIDIVRFAQGDKEEFASWKNDCFDCRWFGYFPLLFGLLGDW